jgi:triosephosphate isomerase
MRKPVIAGNWKMYKTVGDSVATALALKPLVANANHCEVVIAPVFTALKSVADRLEGSNVHVAAQDCAPIAEEGAQTGEVAAFMLRDVGASYVILGHSERRQFYAETDPVVHQKVRAALASGLQVILCVGESLEQRQRGIEVQVVATQLRGSLAGLTASDLDRIIVAYEPIWAIGTGTAATPEQAQEMHGLIRRAFSEKISETGAARLRILYGGSVKPDNIKALMSQPDIDGVLVGGASLKAESFAEIVNYK